MSPAKGSKLDLAVKRSNVNVRPSLSNFGRSLVLYVQILSHKAPSALEKIFKGFFTKYGHGGHLDQWTATILATFCSPQSEEASYEF